jgi:ribosomal protein S18 acetylase RimI-like enzyme
MLNVILRAATEDDSEFVFLVKKAALGTYIEQTWGWDESFQRQYHQTNYVSGQTRIIVADGIDVGWMIVGETDSALELHEIYLQPEHQSRGIGSHLIKTLLAEAERHSKPVTLQVLKVNVRARQLYEQLGFQSAGETETHFLMTAGG